MPSSETERRAVMVLGCGSPSWTRFELSQHAQLRRSGPCSRRFNNLRYLRISKGWSISSAVSESAPSVRPARARSPAVFRWVLQQLAREGLLRGKNRGRRCHLAGSQRGAEIDCAAGQRRQLRGARPPFYAVRGVAGAERGRATAVPPHAEEVAVEPGVSESA